jgi:hypothetical protein
MNENNVKNAPDEYCRIMKDFLGDILRTFPEFTEKITLGEKNILNDINNEETKKLYDYCCKTYPTRFFDILYKNEDLFIENNEKNCFFLPNIDFKLIWKEDLGDKTKDIIWKYLQLILFSISSSLTESDCFGPTAKLFEAIDENELKEKLSETIEEMSNMFDISNIDLDEIKKETEKQFTSDDLPNPEDLQEHISGLLNGKLGRLAAEIAEETAAGLNIDMENVDSVGDVFQTLFKNPGNLMNMVKKVGSKLDEKMKSGELKESELMQEATELMEKMKSMPGMKQMDSIFNKMGIPTGGNKGKVNMNQFQSHMKRNIKHATQRERMRAKLEQRRMQKEIEEKVKEEMLKKKEFIQSTFKGDGIMNKSLREPEKKKKKKKRKKKNKGKKKN